MNNTSIVPQGTIVNGRIIGAMVRRNKQVNYEWTCEVHPEKTGVARIKDMKVKRPRCCYFAQSLGPNSPSWRGTGILSAKKYNQIKGGAARRRKKEGGIEFSVSPEYLIRVWEHQQGKCAYTGRDLVDINSSEASLDRVWSPKGYVEGNVEWVHRDVNLAKQQLSRSDFILLCGEVENHVRKHGINRESIHQMYDDPSGPLILWSHGTGVINP